MGSDRGCAITDTECRPQSFNFLPLSCCRAEEPYLDRDRGFGVPSLDEQTRLDVVFGQCSRKPCDAVSGSDHREQRRGEMTRMEASDIADTILFIVTRPWHVAINEVLIRPTEQAD